MVGFEMKQITEILQERKTVGRFWLKSEFMEWEGLASTEETLMWKCLSS